MNKKRRRKPSASGAEPAATVDPGLGGDTGRQKNIQWPALTGLRGLAAFAVFCQHAYLLTGKPVLALGILNWLFAMGGTGVDVFFTLSAFLLTIPFVTSAQAAAPAPDLRDYAKRRLLRIVPAYYVQMAILIGLSALGVIEGWVWNGATIGSVLAHLTFYLNAWPLVSPRVAPWWTLPVEMWFYLLLPLFARCLRPGRWWWLLLGIAASLAYRYVLMRTGSGLTPGRQLIWADQLPGRLHEFLIGMLAAYVYVRLRATARLPAGRLADVLVAVPLLVFLMLPGLGFLVTGSAYVGMADPSPILQAWHLYASLTIAVLLVALTSGAPLLGRFFSWAPFRALGLVSYSFYLWQFPMLIAVRNSLGYENSRSDFWTFFIYGLIVTLLVALVSWWMVERPAQEWGRRVAARPGRKSAAAGVQA